MKTIATIVLVSMLGCSPKGAAITGTVTFSLGLAVYSGGDGCDGQSLCLFTNQDIGGLMMVIGGLIIGGGLLTYLARGPTPEHVVPPNAPPAPFPVADQPPGDPGQVYVGPPPPQEPVVEPGQPPLPAAQLRYEDPTQRQYAFQASAAARQGNCAGAVASGKQLWVELEQQLRTVDAAYAQCTANR